MKIKDMVIGSTVETTLLVKASEIKKTRADKPYLFVTLTDGSDDLQGQDWDYGNSTPPAVNSVLVVKGQVSEYMGRKQIKILGFAPSNEGVERFAPKGDVDFESYKLMAKKLIEGIKNNILREIVREVFNDNNEALKLLPAAKGMHHAYVHGLLQHTVDVTLKAEAIAKLTNNANVDLVVAGALLHDMGKFWTYYMNGAVIDMTDQGQLIEHIMLGAIKLESYRKEHNSDIIDLLQHIISSHHGELEYGSPTTPRCIEAVIVNMADNVDAKCQMINEVIAKSPEGKWTDKVWALGNRQMLSPAHINEVLA